MLCLGESKQEEASYLNEISNEINEMNKDFSSLKEIIQKMEKSYK